VVLCLADGFGDLLVDGPGERGGLVASSTHIGASPAKNTEETGAVINTRTAQIALQRFPDLVDVID
jgi:hypothetical protein